MSGFVCFEIHREEALKRDLVFKDPYVTFKSYKEASPILDLIFHPVARKISYTTQMFAFGGFWPFALALKSFLGFGQSRTLSSIKLRAQTLLK